GSQLVHPSDGFAAWRNSAGGSLSQGDGEFASVHDDGSDHASFARIEAGGAGIQKLLEADGLVVVGRPLVGLEVVLVIPVDAEGDGADEGLHEEPEAVLATVDDVDP